MSVLPSGLSVLQAPSKTIRSCTYVAVGIALAALCLFMTGCDMSEPTDEPSMPTGPPTGPETIVPDAPANLSAAASDAHVDLTWDAVPEATSYTVYRSTSPGSAAAGNALDTGLTSTEYVDSTAVNGTTYFYQVTGVADEEGDPSNEVEVTPFPEPPNRP